MGVGAGAGIGVGPGESTKLGAEAQHRNLGDKLKDVCSREVGEVDLGGSWDVTMDMKGDMLDGQRQ